MFFIELLHVFFNNILNICIQRSNQCTAILCSDRCTLQRGIFRQITILSAICSIQCCIVIFFQSVCSVIIGACKADHGRCQRIIRIFSFVLFLKPDTDNGAVFLLCFLERCHRLIFQLLCSNIILAVCILGNIIADRIDIQIKILIQRL